MKLLLQKSHHLIVWLGLLPVLLAFAAYRTSTEHYESVQATLATDEFLGQLSDVLSTLKDAETGQRGFLLTGRTQYLAPYRDAVKSIDAEMARVSKLARANGTSSQEVNQLREAVTGKMYELRLTIDLLERSGQEAALEEVRTGRGEAYMANARVLVSKIRSEQKGILATRLEQQRRSQEALEAVLVAGVGAGLLLLFFAYRFSSLYALDRDRAEAEMRHAAENLESRVAERTAELGAQTRQLEKLAGELQRSNQDLLQFAYIASHDLQEPLRTIGSYVSLLARRYGNQLDESAKLYIQFAVDGASRMQTLINDLLNYSRVGTQNLEKKTISADDILKKALTNLQIRIEETGAIVRSTDLPSIEADEARMTQVLQNLIANAIKFRKESAVPEVTIRALHESDQWIFSVSDNGIGFEEKYTDRIFEVFQRLHGVGKYQGNGIGLAICRRIIEHHGGRLWAQSTPGAGSTFSFSVPAKGGSTLRNQGALKIVDVAAPERTARV